MRASSARCDASRRPSSHGLSRRGFLRGAAVAGGGLAVAGLAACTAGAGAGWTYGPARLARRGLAAHRPRRVRRAASVAAVHASHPPASCDRRTVASRRPLRSRPAGPSTMSRRRRRWTGSSPANGSRCRARQPAAGRRRIDGDEGLRAHDRLDQAPDRRPEGSASTRSATTARGPARSLRVTEGDTVRAIFTNNLAETTGVHFHGQALPNGMDGVPMITQDPIVPGRVVHLRVHGEAGRLAHVPLAPQRDRPGGPRPAGRLHRRSRRTRPSATTRSTASARTSSGSATTSWAASRSTAGASRRPRRSSPSWATAIAIRFMNEGVMMHPWHLHGMPLPGRRARRLAAGRRRVPLRHARRQPGRALGRDRRLRQPRRVGVPLPHPSPRRGHAGHVRHGHRADRAGVMWRSVRSPTCSHFGTVLLATDLTAASEAATQRAIELAGQLNARLLIVNVLGDHAGSTHPATRPPAGRGS